MDRRSLLAILTLSIAMPALAQQRKPAAKQRVVIQVSDNDPAKWNLALNNARNIQSDLGKDNVLIEVVAYGPGLEMMKAESKVADRLAAALDGNVGLLACENTMANTKVNKADIAGGVKFVPSGVTHIIRRQQEGWAYLRP
ncbi:MAG TPA: DsrE family protein [Burkholderiales bacterium]|nr:DsrE family protein [Burkholderiales bacterium]